MTLVPYARSRAWFGMLVVFIGAAVQAGTAPSSAPVPYNPVLEWNQIFIDTLIATNTPNSSSPRLGAIVHASIFDAYNGIEKRYTPLFVPPRAAPGASRHAAVIAAAYTALVGVFPTRKDDLDARYVAALASLDDRERKGEGAWHSRARALAWQSRERGIAWGIEVAQSMLARRATDGFTATYPAFTGGTVTGQWRPVAPATSMSAQALAFTDTFVLSSNSQFRPTAPRALGSATYAADYNAVKALGRNAGSTRTADQTVLAPFWESNASVHWNQAANQMSRANRLSISETNRLFAVLNLAMADTVFTIWSAKRFYGDVATEVTWRPTTAIAMADTDGNPDTAPETGWLPLITTPSHPEYPAGHPSLNGAAATVLLRHFSDRQMFTLTAPLQPDRVYTRITKARADGNNARVWGGMHYPSTVVISDGVGEAIARYVDRHSMRRIHR